MNISLPTHRRVPWDAGGRLDGRPLGDAHPLAAGSRVISPQLGFRPLVLRICAATRLIVRLRDRRPEPVAGAR